MPPLPETDAGLVDALRGALDQVGLRATDRLAAAHDASHYLLTPSAVVTPGDVEEVAALLRAAHRHGFSVTFRSGGTSLSGQSVTDGVLADTRQGFRDVEVLDDGARVRCGPGAVLRSVNARLRRHGTALGPDPASEVACTIGGVVANNSSGMACGTSANTYRTLESAVLVLPSGTVVDTGAPDADEALRRDEPALHAGLARLRDEIRADPVATERIATLYAIKNTMGYGVNSFVDHDEPVRILEHLVIGSEGTLAFVAEATFRTVPVRPHAATALLVFDDLASATGALPEIVAAGPATVELLDARSLLVAQRDPACPEEIAGLDVAAHCALLVELQEADDGALQARLAETDGLWAGLPLVHAATFTSDPTRRAALWHARKGLFTTVAGNRRSGTTALLEDIAVPVPELGATCTELTALFDRYGYDDAVIFGHAKDGNIHFMITEDFGDEDEPGDGRQSVEGGDRSAPMTAPGTAPAAAPGTAPMTAPVPPGLEHLRRYADFTEEMAELVLRRGGTLKAEHGTGRIMAPFVRRQVGDHLYRVMQQVKALVDPGGVLGPGVLITDDPHAHLRHLKTAPPVEDEVDRCVECGYCEPVCPSRDLTLTPRERIVLRRERARAEARGDDALAAELRAEYAYDGVQTCAVDGMCQTSCPVLINTGDLVRRLRAEETGAAGSRAWRGAAQHWGLVSRAGGGALTAAAALPSVVAGGASTLARGVLGAERVPQHSSDLPAGGRPRPEISDAGAEAVWFPSCTSTLFAAADGGRGVADAVQRICAAAGVRIRTPDRIGGLCCGTPWKSKGLRAGHEEMRTRVLAALREATDGGVLPVLSDASSCTEGLRELLGVGDGAPDLVVVDAVAFVAERVLPTLLAQGRIARTLPSLTLHPTCSSTRLGLDAHLRTVAESVAEEVVVPDSWGCCAFAGDRGMLHPELTDAATAQEAREVAALGSAAHASVNRTCEMGMTRATGESYRHVLELLADALV